MTTLLAEFGAVKKNIDAIVEQSRAMMNVDPHAGLALIGEAEALLAHDSFYEKPYDSGLARIRRTQARFFEQIGEYHESLRCCQEALEIYTRLEDTNGRAVMISLTGSMYDHLGDYSTALSLMREAEQLFESLDDESSLSGVLSNMGLILHRSGEFDQELALYDRLLKLDEKLNNPRQRCITLNNKAMAFQALGQLEQAIDCCQASLALAQQFKEPLLVANIQCTLGEILLEKGDLDLAFNEFEDSLLAAREQRSPFIELCARAAIGKLWANRGEDEKALESMRAALSIAEQIGEEEAIYEGHRSLSDVLRRLGRFEEALHHLDEFHRRDKMLAQEADKQRIKDMEYRHQVEFSNQETLTAQAREAEVRALFEQSPVGIIEFDLSAIKVIIDRSGAAGNLANYIREQPAFLDQLIPLGKVTHANDRMAVLSGENSPAEFIGKFDPVLAVTDTQSVLEMVLIAVDGGYLPFEATLSVVDAGGRSAWIDCYLSIVKGHEKTWDRLIMTVLDSTAREDAKHALVQSEALYRSVSDLAYDGIGIISDGRFSYCNAQMAQILGREIDEVIGVNFAHFITRDFLPEVLEQYQLFMQAEPVHQVLRSQLLRPGGEIVDVEISASPLSPGQNPKLMVMARNITGQVRMENQLKEMAITDPLTGLKNRRHFFEHAVAIWDQANRYNRVLSVLLIDIDHFKGVNDVYGHAVGDAVLRELAARMETILRASDLLARFGGEEFVILMPETDGQEVQIAAGRILRAISKKPFPIEDTWVTITVSIGCTTLNLNRRLPLDELLIKADQALYQAKRRGRDQVSVWAAD
jgi:diguanylate cyclase (GGDEF)-like protein/PAS domain S-box-containing protein